MAKIDGTQEIPSALLNAYRGTLGEQVTGKGIGKRFPFRLPNMQNVGGHPSTKQRAQRTRFKTALNDFANVDAPTRARWYAAEPPWSSFLWYYNYFIMSSLGGNANADAGGFGLIKSIQFKTIAMPSGSGEGQVAITAIDPTKSVVMLYGNSLAQVVTDIGNLWANIYPYPSSIAAELVKCKWSLADAGWGDTIAADIGITVIEYI